MIGFKVGKICIFWINQYVETVDRLKNQPAWLMKLKIWDVDELLITSPVISGTIKRQSS
jgi:hypothetical protein